jgi:hypothetical protein
MAKAKVDKRTPPPRLEQVYTDSSGRELRVTKIDLSNPQMSHVQGVIKKDGVYYPYSCMLDIWEKVWYNKAPAQERPGMEA